MNIFFWRKPKVYPKFCDIDGCPMKELWFMEKWPQYDVMTGIGHKVERLFWACSSKDKIDEHHVYYSKIDLKQERTVEVPSKCASDEVKLTNEL